MMIFPTSELLPFQKTTQNKDFSQEMFLIETQFTTLPCFHFNLALISTAQRQ